MEEKESCGIMAIDLKSFYASCECVERGLDSIDAYLVVADGGRTEKPICLAVRPALKIFEAEDGREKAGGKLLPGFRLEGLFFFGSFLYYGTSQNGSVHGVQQKNL